MLDYILTFYIDIKSVIKVNKKIGLIRKFQRIFLRASVVTIYKALTRPYLD